MTLQAMAFDEPRACGRKAAGLDRPNSHPKQTGQDKTMTASQESHAQRTGVLKFNRCPKSTQRVAAEVTRLRWQPETYSAFTRVMIRAIALRCPWSRSLVLSLGPLRLCFFAPLRLIFFRSFTAGVAKWQTHRT